MARNKYDVDETLETKFDMKQIIRLFHYVGPYRKKLIATIVLMLSSSALGMVIPVLTQRVMDIYIPDGDKKSIVTMAFIALVIIVVCAFNVRIKIKWTTEIGQGIIHSLRSDLFEHLQELPFSYYDSRPHGKIQVRLVNYVNNISDLLSNGIVNTITDCCSLIFIICFMFYYSVPLTLILPRYLGVTGALYSGPIADVVSFAAAVFCVRRVFRELKKEETGDGRTAVSEDRVRCIS